MLHNLVYDLSSVPSGPLPIKMFASDATAMRLFDWETDGRVVGASFIRFPGDGCILSHIHAGCHVLSVEDGDGTLILNGVPTPLTKGMVYLVPPGVPHEIHAGSAGLDLLVIGDDLQPEDSKERLEIK